MHSNLNSLYPNNFASCVIFHLNSTTIFNLISSKLVPMTMRHHMMRNPKSSTHSSLDELVVIQKTASTSLALSLATFVALLIALCFSPLFLNFRHSCAPHRETQSTSCDPWTFDGMIWTCFYFYCKTSKVDLYLE